MAAAQPYAQPSCKEHCVFTGLLSSSALSGTWQQVSSIHSVSQFWKCISMSTSPSCEELFVLSGTWQPESSTHSVSESILEFSVSTTKSGCTESPGSVRWKDGVRGPLWSENAVSCGRKLKRVVPHVCSFCLPSNDHKHWSWRDACVPRDTNHLAIGMLTRHVL